MGEEGARSRDADGRVSLGVPALDRMLEGGLVAGRPYLIVGPSGTGKTTLALQFLCDGIRRGERGLYVTIENPPNEIRVNHRALGDELEAIDVFDAIPDVMRYEKAPFKDIASARDIVPFRSVPLGIRQSPEFSSVEVTVAALEQMLRSEVPRRKYTRIVIDSLTALQYFCMKGLDHVAGAQSFLRFLSDLRVTSVLTVEAPLEDVETPERVLARGEVRLFRWELDGRTVRAIGVEKFRGSSHDVRLHPYRIGGKGLDVNLGQTISRDSRRIVESALELVAPKLAEGAESELGSLSEAVRDLLLLGIDVSPVRAEVEEALLAVHRKRPDKSEPHLARVASLVIALAEPRLEATSGPVGLPEAQAAAYLRCAERAERARTGAPPTRLPPVKLLESELQDVLKLLPPGVPAGAAFGTPYGHVGTAGTLGAASLATPEAVASPGTSPAPVREPPVLQTESASGPTEVELPPAELPAEPLLSPPVGATVPPGSSVRAKSVPIPEPPPLPARALPAKGGATAGPEALGPPTVPAPLPEPPSVTRTRSSAEGVPPPLPPLRSLPVESPAETSPASPAGRPKRTRKAPAKRRTSAAATPAGTGAAPGGEGTPPSKPRRRTVRRRKAPPVVSAVEESPPGGATGSSPPELPPPKEDA